MARDRRGDRYSRRDDAPSERLSSADNNTTSSKTSTRYGRYAGKRRSRSRSRSRSPRSRRRADNDDRRRRHGSRGRGRSGSREAVRRSGGRRRSRSRGSSSSRDTSRRGAGGRPRFEAVDVQELIHSDLQTAASGNAPLLPSPDMMWSLYQQQQQQQDNVEPVGRGNLLPLPDTPCVMEIGVPVPYPDMININNEPQPQQTQEEEDMVQQEETENIRYMEEMENEKKQDETAETAEKEGAKKDVDPEPIVPKRVLPSVEDFVPVIPKSLLSLLSGPATTTTTTTNGVGGGDSHTGDRTAFGSLNAGNENDGGQKGVLTTTTGALAVLQAPKLSPEAERCAREARRAHISSFPPSTTREELMDYFNTIIPMVRRVKVQREMDLYTEKLREEGGPDADVERREIPINAMVDVDRVIDLAVNNAKSKPFAFLEVNMADLVTELVDESQRDPERFSFIATDGRSYPITIRRPRDYQVLPGVENRKVVMLGFPSTLSPEKIRMVFEQFGSLLAFDVKNGMAYGEFENEADAVDFVRELHGETLGNNVVVLMPLYDWLKVVCTHAGIDVSLDPDDPVSGTSLLAKEGQIEGSLVPVLAEDVRKEEEPVDHMKELVELTVQLPDVVLHFAKTFPHLATLYGGTVPIYPTRILVLLNLFDEEELVLDDTYENLVHDISLEVEKYGRVKSLIVPRRFPPPVPPKPPKNYFASRINTSKRTDGGNYNPAGGGGRGAPSMVSQMSRDNGPSAEDESENSVMNENDEEKEYEVAKKEYLKAREEYTERLMHPIHGGFGRVFVEYESIDEAAAAQRAIAGRLFGGRTVVTSFMFEDVLYPPTADEIAAEADKKIQLYLEGIGAADGDEETQEGNAASLSQTEDVTGMEEV